MTTRRLLPVAILALMTMVGTASAQPYPPVPGPRVEVVPGPPPGAYVWQPGHWYWSGYRYVWVGGHYVPRYPHYAQYAPGGWVWRGNHWVWAPAHWR